jgi:hypothetical protein
MESNTWCPRLTAAMILSGSAVHVKGFGSALVSARKRLMAVWRKTPPYVAGPHPWADKFVPRHLSDGFGQFPFVYGDPLANQFDGSFLIGFVCKKIPHDSRVSLGIESRDPDVPSCWHSHAP